MKLIGWIAKNNPDLRFAFAMERDNNALTAEAFKFGATEYIDKRTLSAHAFLNIIGKLHSANIESAADYTYRSEAYKDCLRKSEKSYSNKDTLLLCGEIGSGKSHIAKRIHAQGDRRNLPFIQVKCALLEDSVAIPYLSGCQGINNTKAFQRVLSNVDSGTLFFDEIEKLPMTAQSLLAHVIEEGYLHLGSSSVQKSFKGKIIVSSSSDLDACVTNGTLRRDLYDLICHNFVCVPPLRMCQEDIIPFAEYFLDKSTSEWQAIPKRLSEPVKRHLLSHQWTGNIRELRSVINLAASECDSSVIKAGHLRLCCNAHAEGVSESQSKREALDLAGNNKTIASRILGISRPTLYAKMAKLDL